MAEKVDFRTPAARLVWGDLYEAQTKDMEGRPLTVKSGPNIGQPRVDYAFGVAIPKGPEAAAGPYGWTQTEWGAAIMQMGAKMFPQQYNTDPDFAWKVTDGDNTKPGKPFNGKPGRAPCTIEGYAGHWVLKFGSGFAPQICNADGSQLLPLPTPQNPTKAVVPGYWVQVFGSIQGNGSGTKPGIFLNHRAVALCGYGPVITSGVALSAMGFGVGVQLPAGASLTPLAGVAGLPAAAGAPAAAAPGVMPTLPSVAMPGMPGTAAMPGMPGLPGAATAMPTMPGVPGAMSGVVMPGMPATAPAAAPMAVQPNQGFVTLPGMPAAAPPAMPVMPAPAPAAAPQYVMTAKAGGATYEAFVANGWTFDALLRDGFIAVAPH